MASIVEEMGLRSASKEEAIAQEDSAKSALASAYVGEVTPPLCSAKVLSSLATLQVVQTLYAFFDLSHT